MEFRLLGPLEVGHTGGVVALGGPRQRAVFAALLLHANDTVSVSYLVDAAWETPPATPGSNIRTYVAGLRRRLDAAGSAASRLVSRPGGYALRVEPGELDLATFDELAGRGEQALRAGEVAEAATCFEEALRLWRGQPLEGLAVGPPVRAELARLDERRLIVVEQHAQTMIELGRYEPLIGELRRAVLRHPLREQLWAQLMRALYQADRAAEALQAYESARRVLADELGADPGPELRRLHQGMLRGDGWLPAGRAERRTVEVRRNALPRDLADFTGREDELRRLRVALSDASMRAVPIVTIDGMAGVGKTALVVHAAHRLADRYPDAQLMIDLHAHTPDREPLDAAAALDELLRAWGVPADEIPRGLNEQTARWRSELADRRALIVLDNAASAEQIRPLLPGSPGCLVLVTSRRQLVELESNLAISLDLLTPSDAVTLFARVAGEQRAAAELDSVREVVALCGNLPLAIRLAAARLRSRPTWSVSHLADRLRDGQRRLSELSGTDRGVAAAFTLSYHHLAPGQQRLFRLLGLHPGTDLDAYLAAALADLGLRDADQFLEDLLDVHLLQQPAVGRYRFHDLLRQYARTTVERNEPESSRRQAVTRMLDYYLHVAHLAAEQLNPGGRHAAVGSARRPAENPTVADHAAALAWLETERTNLADAAAYAAGHGWYTHAWQLPHALWFFYFIRGHAKDWTTTHRLALDASEHLNDQVALAVTRKNLGTACWQTGKYDEALEHYRYALAGYRAVGDDHGRSAVLNNLGLIYRSLHRYEDAVDHYREALVLARKTGDRQGEGQTLGNLGSVYERLGRYETAIDHTRQALDLMRETGDRRDEGDTLSTLGTIYRHLGQYDRSREHLHQALRIAREVGDRTTETVILNDIAETHRAQGQYREALLHHHQALDHSRTVQDRLQQARAHDGIGHLLRERDLAAARQNWRQALDIYTELGLPEADELRHRINQLGNRRR
ncbi:BTAD domain-containing putative transcriptional regulator [Planosporangium sp. 12N6]|uniref:AfsR/SARP family transcriptional regulator n=1 Tax=Planosporangium spinosum TaxID=3402278 RepID=UPI003CF3BEF1